MCVSVCVCTRTQACVRQGVVAQERQLCGYFIVFLKLLYWMLKHFIRLFNIPGFCCSYCLGFRVSPCGINSFLYLHTNCGKGICPVRTLPLPFSLCDIWFSSIPFWNSLDISLNSSNFNTDTMDFGRLT